MKKRIFAVIAAVILFFGIAAVSVRYYSFVSQTIYSESISHLTEIFHQANRSLNNLVGRNWTNMHLWADYLQDVTDEKEIDSFIAHAKEETGFTDFYFISREGNYHTVSGETGYLDLKEELPELILNGKDIVVNSVVPGKPQIMVFVIPAVRSTYKGFEYEAIAVSYNNSDMVNALKISAFDGHSSSYVIHSDGRVIVDNAADKQQDIYNFIAMLKKYSDMTNEELELFRYDLIHGNPGATVVSIGNVSYYLIYESANFEDWSVLGLVPASIVNASMNSLQSSTLILAAGITICIAALMIAYVIRRNQQKLKKKDTEILYRDELFSKLSVNVDDVFLMLNAENLRVDYISPNIEKLMGIPEKQVRGDIHAMDSLVRHDDTVRVLDKLHEILPGEQGEWDREYVHRKTGEVRWFHVIALCSDINGEKKYIMVMSDRTRDKKINQALEDAVDAAQSANRAKSTFLSNMSHDIRTPMNAILGFATLMEDSIADTEKLRDYLGKIRSSGEFLLSLINNVLEMAKIESGKTELDETSVNLREAQKQLCSVFDAEIKKKKLTYTHSMDIIHENVYLDKTKDREIFTNLISNAIKYTTDGGKIDVSVTELPQTKEGYADYRIVVADTGIGMSPEYIPHMFDSFVRERNSTASKISGTGLGLPIVKSLVDLMGGTIEVESELGKGTKFTITMSHRICDDSDIQKKDNSESLTDIPDMTGKRILLAEDNELNAEIAIAILENAGFSVERAEDGIVCVDMVEKAEPGHFDIILMDIQMPNMDGFKATNVIRMLPDAVKAKVPIVAMTANAFEEDKKAALEAGMNGFISKPIQIPELMKTISSVL